MRGFGLFLVRCAGCTDQGVMSRRSPGPLGWSCLDRWPGLGRRDGIGGGRQPFGRRWLSLRAGEVRGVDGAAETDHEVFLLTVRNRAWTQIRRASPPFGAADASSALVS